MTIIPHFTNLDTLELRFYNGTNKLPLPAHDFHSLSLPISSLEIGFNDKFLPTHDRRLLEDLFACLTLPLLGTFRLTSQNTPPFRSPGRMPNFSPSLFGLRSTPIFACSI
ncbi:hypothetical protein B0H13DRAFT_2278426 [Mycena leptocephala]|nr:hypothetical protein B0H13DRAFT_2278426 [Mycena leptocephala]